MSNSGNSIKHDAIREIDASSLTTSYQNLGGVLLRDAFRIWVTNNTNGDIYITHTDNTQDEMKLPAQSGRAYDNKTNDMYFKSGTQFEIRFDSAPGVPSGWAALEVEYV